MDEYGERYDYPELLRRAKEIRKLYERKEMLARLAAGDAIVFIKPRLSLDEKRALRNRLAEDLLKG